MSKSIIHLDNLLKYHSTAGRYTLFPALNVWKNDVDTKSWLNDFSENYNKEEGVDLYIHIPFCESLCTFCGCNIKVTKDHDEQDRYISALLKEFSHYKNSIGKIKIASLYFGGGSPNYLTPKNLNFLITEIFQDNIKSEDFHGAYECDSRTLTEEHIKVLGRHQFSQLSIGVQSFDENVLRNVNRYQDYESIASTTLLARHYGIKEVHYDIIYGLPLQTVETMSDTIKKLIKLKPDAVAFYPLANAPWQNNTQRAYGQYNLPEQDEKYKLFLKGNELLVDSELKFIGMSHYYSVNSKVYKAFKEDELQRNICGFNSTKSKQLMAIGVSSIGQSGSNFVQKEKVLGKYYSIVERDKLPISRSHKKTEHQKIVHQLFIDVISKKEVQIQRILSLISNKSDFLKQLNNFKEDGLLAFDEEYLSITDEGRYFLRTICMTIELFIK